MSTYMLLNAAIIFFPFILSFDKKVAYFKFWPRVLAAVIIVSSIYIFWDILAAGNGDWWFNHKYTGTAVLGKLPPGELLFFFTVPYACLFIYQVVKSYFKEKTLKIGNWSNLIPAILSILSIAIAFIFCRSKSYTFTVLLFLAGMSILLGISGLFKRRSFWLYIGLSFIPFIIFNGILTGLPVVLYNEAAFSGIRIGTIPLEDFAYNFSLLGYYGLLYHWFGKIFEFRKSSGFVKEPG